MRIILKLHMPLCSISFAKVLSLEQRTLTERPDEVSNFEFQEAQPENLNTARLNQIHSENESRSYKSLDTRLPSPITIYSVIRSQFLSTTDFLQYFSTNIKTSRIVGLEKRLMTHSKPYDCQ